MRRGPLILALAFTCACQVDTGTDPDDPGPREVTARSVDPADTDTGISNVSGMHRVFTPAALGRTRTLVLFLPGTGGRPELYTRFLHHAAELGHHAVGLAYPNAEGVNDLCSSVPSASCEEEARIEVITGSPRSAVVNVNTNNSIDNRLRALLTWLDDNFREEGWSAYLANGEPRWERIIVAGHAQGGGHAAMIARLRAVQRAVLFSATEPAPWTATPFETAPDRIFGFAHRSEPGYAGVSASWRLMELRGPVASVDGATPPFAGAHQLQTGVATCRPAPLLEPLHNCVITDAVTPLGPNTRPVFAPVWTYLLDG